MKKTTTFLVLACFSLSPVFSQTNVQETSLSLLGQSLGFNRDVTNGYIFNRTRHAYQFQHTPSSVVGEDFLALQVYWPNGDGLAPYALVVNSNSNVGIGTSSPSQKLEVHGNIRLGSEYNHILFPVVQGVGGGITGDDTQFKRLTLYHGSAIAFETGANEVNYNNTRLFINNDGNIGVGTNSPVTKLDIAGVLQTRNLQTTGAYWDNLQLWSDGANSYIQSNGDEGGLKIKSAGGNKVLFESKVGIGTEQVDNENFNLFVEKGILTRKIKVTQATWADYVFDSSYQLAPLSHVEKFIQENKHLPEVPSAAEVKKDGVDIGDNQVVLLKKIEELTLYIIQQNKQIVQQNEQLGKQNMDIQQLKKELEVIKTSLSNGSCR